MFVTVNLFAVNGPITVAIARGDVPCRYGRTHQNQYPRGIDHFGDIPVHLYFANRGPGYPIE
jgi:hypothetical protein